MVCALATSINSVSSTFLMRRSIFTFGTFATGEVSGSTSQLSSVPALAAAAYICHFLLCLLANLSQ